MLTGGPGACETTSTAAPGNGTYPTTPVPTGTNSTATSTASTTLVPTAAAARPTGAFVGAAAVGGLLGAVAML
ncbi:hypothetical protein NUW58_g10782 [Xylaria curta]|uniref:Uncharacterized protein n=1 Tax=Xylaria curta TaxID=42375 RepID=A0ACC1MI90_9PEZI|nr:hypothetical protein NUW58_g10782 [Xylaria curta]